MSFLCLDFKLTIHLAQKAQIILLLSKEITVLIKYSNFANLFSKKSVEMLLEQIGINEHAIKLEEDKQPLSRLIYNIRPIEFKTLRTYIEINLANGFIRSSKSLAGIPIVFVEKPNGSLCLYINYQDLNNLTIKNRYLLLLIDEFLNRLG